MEKWIEKNVLITIKTYPEISRTHTETVCTGGILADSKRLIRLYPVRYRYLEGDRQFAKYQWIKAKMKKASRDYRPESYNLDNNSIEMGQTIGTEDGWQERERYVLNPKNVFSSLEELHTARQTNHVSMGIIKPKKVTGLSIIRKTSEEVDEAEKKKANIMAQKDLFDDIKELELLPVKFLLNFLCDDQNCTGHKLSILDWEIGQLYRNVKRQIGWEEKVKKKIESDLCGDDKVTYLFVGNMIKHPKTFCILGFFYPPRRRQQPLF